MLLLLSSALSLHYPLSILLTSVPATLGSVLWPVLLTGFDGILLARLPLGSFFCFPGRCTMKSLATRRASFYGQGSLGRFSRTGTCRSVHLLLLLSWWNLHWGAQGVRSPSSSVCNFTCTHYLLVGLYCPPATYPILFCVALQVFNPS